MRQQQNLHPWGTNHTAVALKQEGPWTYGGLANHIWSINGDTDISTTFMQPFLTYTTPDTISLTALTETAYNREASEGNEWSVPLLFMVTKVGKIGSQTVSYGGGVKYYAKSPDGGPEGWGLRFEGKGSDPKL